MNSKNTIRKLFKLSSEENRLRLLKEIDHLIFAEQIKPLIKPSKKYKTVIDFTDYPYFSDKN